MGHIDSGTGTYSAWFWLALFAFGVFVLVVVCSGTYWYDRPYRVQHDVYSWVRNQDGTLQLVPMKQETWTSHGNNLDALSYDIEGVRRTADNPDALTF